MWRLQDDGVLGQAADAGGPAAVAAPANNTTNNLNQQPIGPGGQGSGIDPIYQYPGNLVPATAMDDYFYGSRYIGYAPEITLLDIGTVLMVNQGDVAVSPDRRYVFMRLTPYFNTIRGVYEYNLSTGTTRASSAGNSNINNQMLNRGGASAAPPTK